MKLDSDSARVGFYTCSLFAFSFRVAMALASDTNRLVLYLSSLNQSLSIKGATIRGHILRRGKYANDDASEKLGGTNLLQGLLAMAA